MAEMTRNKYASYLSLSKSLNIWKFFLDFPKCSFAQPSYGSENWRAQILSLLKSYFYWELNLSFFILVKRLSCANNSAASRTVRIQEKSAFKPPCSYIHGIKCIPCRGVTSVHPCGGKGDDTILDSTFDHSRTSPAIALCKNWNMFFEKFRILLFSSNFIPCVLDLVCNIDSPLAGFRWHQLSKLHLCWSPCKILMLN